MPYRICFGIIAFCMMTGTKKLLFAIAVGVGLSALADADLSQQLDSIINRPSLSKVQFSVCIVKADTGRAVYSYNADKPMLPASNMKVIITTAALKYLGPNYKYRTKIGLCGDTLAIIGSGDPLLADKTTDDKYGRQPGWLFENIAAVLKNNGITQISNIIVDSSIFDDQRVHPSWPKDQLNRSYACEVSGLNFNGNCIEVSAKTTAGKTTVSVEPQTSYVKITNKVKPITKGKAAIGSYRQPQPNSITVFGKCKKQQGPFPVAIERPAAFFGFLLAENLAKAGIKVRGQFIEKKLDRNCNFKGLLEHTTAISDCLQRCNKDSFGLASEALFKTIAAVNEPSGCNGSWIKARQLVSQYLQSLGISENEFYIDDGSGLSRENRLSANVLTRVLLDVYRSSNWSLYRDCLAAGGIDGTIARHFKEQKYRGRIFGKTGYISGVKSFSGVCSSKDGDYIFAILANNTNGKTRPAINDIVKAVIDQQQ